MTTLEREPRPRIKRLVVGRPKSSGEFEETLLPKRLALPIFASDALSSVAYATEAALVVLLAAAVTGRAALLPVSIAIALLLAIVIVSYQQTVRVYESSGGAYVVAKDNLGTIPSLVGAAALLTDYVLTVAVSVAAGVVALVSAVPSLAGHQVGLALAFIALITIANLRGVRESGLAFALPTYAFIVSMLALVLAAQHAARTVSADRRSHPTRCRSGVGAIGLFVLIRAFASGSTALTGVEAIANGVSAFRRPQARNAARTLGILGILAITFFIGVSYLAIEMDAVPNEGGYPSVVSQIARVSSQVARRAASCTTPSRPRRSPSSCSLRTPPTRASTARRTARARPLLPTPVHQSRRPPRLLERRRRPGRHRRGAPIWIYAADVEALIHLDAIGVFTAFTLSQTGMVRDWLPHARSRLALESTINGVGALATFVVTLVVIWTKFAAGAWMVMVAIPLLVPRLPRHPPALPQDRATTPRRHRGRSRGGTPRNQVIVVPGRGSTSPTESALWYARPIGARRSSCPCTCPGGARTSRSGHAGTRSPAEAAPGGARPGGRTHRRPPRGTVEAPSRRAGGRHRGHPGAVPPPVAPRSPPAGLRFRLKLRLLSEPGVVVADVPAISEKYAPRRTRRRHCSRGCSWRTSMPRPCAP